MTFKPKPTKKPALDHVLKRQEKVTELPTLRSSLPMTQINIRCSEDMALIFSKLADEAGSSRMALAKLMVDAGYTDVPLADRDTRSFMQVRRYRREFTEQQEAVERRRKGVGD